MSVSASISEVSAHTDVSAGTAYTSASRALDQAWAGTDWAAVMRSLATPSSDGSNVVPLSDVVKVLAMSEAALKAKSISAERKAFLAASHAYEKGAELQKQAAALAQNGDLTSAELLAKVQGDMYQFRAQVEAFSCQHLEGLKDETSKISTAAHANNAQSRKLAGALWEMSQKVSKVSEVRRHEFEKMVKERRAETMKNTSDRLFLVERLVARHIRKRRLQAWFNAWWDYGQYKKSQHERVERCKLHYYERLWLKCMRVWAAETRRRTSARVTCELYLVLNKLAQYEDETKQSRSSKAGVSSLGTSVRAALECGPDKGLANEQRDLQLVAYRGRLDCLRRELVMGQKELGEQLAGITAPVWEDGEQSSLLPVHSLAGDSQPQDEYDEDPSSEEEDTAQLEGEQPEVYLKTVRKMQKEILLLKAQLAQHQMDQVSEGGIRRNTPMALELEKQFAREMELLQEFNSNQARSLKDAHRTELNRIQDQHAAEMAGLHHAREALHSQILETANEAGVHSDMSERLKAEQHAHRENVNVLQQQILRERFLRDQEKEARVVYQELLTDYTDNNIQMAIENEVRKREAMEMEIRNLQAELHEMKLNGRRAPTDIGDNVFPPARSNMTKAADHAGPTVALNPASQYSPAARGYQSDNRLTVDSQRGGLLEAHTPPRSSASSVVSSVSGSRRPISSKHLVVAQLVVQGYTTEEAQQAVAKVVGEDNIHAKALEFLKNVTAVSAPSSNLKYGGAK